MRIFMCKFLPFLFHSGWPYEWNVVWDHPALHLHIGIASTLVSVEQQRGPKQMVLSRNNVAQTFMGFKFRERDPNPHGQSAIIPDLAARNWSPPLPKRSICSRILQTEANATARWYARCPERSVEELLERKSFASFGAPRGGTKCRRAAGGVMLASRDQLDVRLSLRP
ncbi:MULTISPECIES: hypothetical protein [unclassified Mesorhizobium]|uniref:hypothetical protein n=1 Tax=unclassified Mesorhizobium TaxID=325217 RepID=UPI000FD4C05C|nr:MULTISPECIES: hypothetical protein [unclassified Mesorhizobium]RUW93543.1 hypothetical protein EOA19_05565 [Mesorhizobium sp. M7A.F.Ca.US.010.02.1.1]